MKQYTKPEIIISMFSAESVSTEEALIDLSADYGTNINNIINNNNNNSVIRNYNFNEAIKFN